MRTLVWLGIMLAFIGCGHGEAAKPAAQEPSTASSSESAPSSEDGPSEASSGKTPENFDRATHMEAMQAMAVTVRDAIVVGDLAKTKELAKEFRAKFDHQPFQGKFRAYIGRLDQALDDVSIAGNLQQAGAGLAAAALACGNCHVFTRGGPHGASVHADLPTQGSETMDERMQRHDVAIEQLWLGLTVPSDDMWVTGGKTLASAPLIPPTHGDEAGRALMAQEVENLRDAARDIRLANTTVERADIFGGLLAGCGVCHREVEP